MGRPQGWPTWVSPVPGFVNTTVLSQTEKGPVWQIVSECPECSLPVCPSIPTCKPGYYEKWIEIKSGNCMSFSCPEEACAKCPEAKPKDKPMLQDARTELPEGCRPPMSDGPSA